jgi:hypothetical protein
MDKLPEPEFTPDKNWPRLLHGVKEMRADNDLTFKKAFAGLTFLTCFRYLREITYYKKNYATSAVAIPLLVFSSYNLARAYAYDPYVLAAEKNNAAELEYISTYKSLYKKAKSQNLEVPNELIY